MEPVDLKGALGLVLIPGHGHILVYPSDDRGYVVITQKGHKDRNGKRMPAGFVGPSDGFYGMGARVVNPKTFSHALLGPGQLNNKNKRSFQLYKGRDASAEEQAEFARRKL